MNARFINVDLDIRSKTNLNPVLAEMGPRVFVMHSGPVGSRHLLAVENARAFKDPDATLHQLCALIEDLSPASRRLWDAAEKQFDIGFEWIHGLAASHFSLRPDTVQRIAKLGATITVTHYREHAVVTRPRKQKPSSRITKPKRAKKRS